MFKINQEYIADNLCINRFDLIPVCKGACYLEDQLNSNGEQQQKMPDLKSAEVFLFCESFDIKNIHPYNTTESRVYPELSDVFISSDYIHAVFHPPALII